MKLAVTSETFGNVNHSWLGSARGLSSARTVPLKVSAFTLATHAPSGYFPDGLPLAVPSSGSNAGFAVPLAARATEVQTVTEGGSGLTSFTLTFDGETTGSIAAAATAATVQTALEALSNVDVGSVTVTGSAGGPYSVTFGTGTQFAGTNVPAMTATPTGGSGTVTIATGTGGGSGVTDGSDVLAGFLAYPQAVKTGDTIVHGPLLDSGRIIVANVPIITLTAALKATNTQFIWV